MGWFGCIGRADYIRQIAENLKADEGKVAALAKQFTTEHGKILFENALRSTDLLTGLCK